MGEATTAQEVSCAYELCRRGDPILVQPGHRLRRFHDAACRQAQHRLAEARKRQEQQLAVLRERWEGYAPETQQLLAVLLSQHGEDCALQVIELLAAERERTRALAPIDLSERAARERQCMAIGELLGYRRIRQYQVSEGLHSWAAFCSLVDDRMLDEVGTYGRVLLREREEASRFASEFNQMYKAREQIKQLQQSEETLKRQLRQLEELLAGEINRLAEEKAATIREKQRKASLLVAELKKQLAATEQQLARYRTLFDLDEAICPWTSLTVVQEYLRDSPANDTVPFKRQGKTIHVLAINNQAMAVTRDQGLLRLNDVEVEQCRLYALHQLGRSVLVSVHSPDDDQDEEQDDLRRAKLRIKMLEHELAKLQHYPPRAALRRAFMRWGEKLGYPSLLIFRGQEAPFSLQQGSEDWQQFVDGLADELLWAAAEGIEAWYYYCRPEELPTDHWLNRRTSMCDTDERMHIVERELARYRGIVEPGERAKLEQAFMAAGEAIGYRQLTNVRAGLDGYQRFMDYSPSENLVKATVEARTYAEALAVQGLRQDSTESHQVEQL
jgi:hypothetical protein